MGTLSQFIQLIRPQVNLDLHCLFQRRFLIPHAPEPNGQALFHLISSGCCRVDTGGRTLTLREDDFILLPRGEAHTIHDPISKGTPTIRPRTSHDGMLPLSQTGQSTVDIDLFYGHFVHEHDSTTLFVHTLPDLLHVPLTDNASFMALQTLIGLMRDEAETRVPGALAIVTSLSQVLLTMTLRAYGQQENASPGTLIPLSGAHLDPSMQATPSAPERARTIDTLADLVIMSRAAYARHFRAQADMTVWDSLTRVRVTLAYEALVRTRFNVGGTDTRVGCRSEAALGKASKQQLGMMPVRYRRGLVSHP